MTKERFLEETIDDLTINYTDEEGVQTILEESKHVLTKGAWTTIMFLHKDLNRTTGEFGESKVTIRRYQKQLGVYKTRSKFTISSAKQAKQIIDILGQWFNETT
jgi:hypothetical protein